MFGAQPATYPNQTLMYPNAPKTIAIELVSQVLAIDTITQVAASAMDMAGAIYNEIDKNIFLKSALTGAALLLTYAIVSNIKSQKIIEKLTQLSDSQAERIKGLNEIIELLKRGDAVRDETISLQNTRFNQALDTVMLRDTQINELETQLNQALETIALKDTRINELETQVIQQDYVMTRQGRVLEVQGDYIIALNERNQELSSQIENLHQV